MIRDHVELRVRSYRVLLDDNNLGEPPTTLSGGEQWEPEGERAQVRANAYRELERLGLARAGRVDPDLMDTVVVLQRPGIEYYTFAKINGRSITARTAAIGKDAVLVVSDGSTMDIYPGDVERLPEQLIWSLPEAPGANVHSMSSLLEDFTAALRGKPVPPGQSGRDAKQMARWVRMPYDDGGQLFTAIRKSGNGRNRCGDPIRWFDTEQGRIAVYLDAGGYLNMISGAVDKMAGRLRQMECERR